MYFLFFMDKNRYKFCLRIFLTDGQLGEWHSACSFREMIILPQDFSDCRNKPQFFPFNEFSPVYFFVAVLNITVIIGHTSLKAYFKYAEIIQTKMEVSI